MAQKFIPMKSIWQPYHVWFPKDEACMRTFKGAGGVTILRIDMPWLRSIVRKDMSPVICNGATNFALTMAVYPTDDKSTTYRFYLN